jgi:hypothetical protein
LYASPHRSPAPLGRCLLERDGQRYAYRLTQKGVRGALLFILATNASADNLGNSLFHGKPAQSHTPTTKLHAAYQKADASLQQIVDLVAA